MSKDNHLTLIKGQSTPDSGHTEVQETPTPKPPFKTNADVEAETVSAEKPTKGDPPFQDLKNKTQDDVTSGHNADPEDSEHSDAVGTDAKSESDPRVQTAGDGTTAPETEDTDGQTDFETVEAQSNSDGESQEADGEASPGPNTDDSGDAATQNSPDKNTSDDETDETDETDDDKDKNKKKTDDSSKGAKPKKKKKKSKIKRSLKDDKLNTAVDNTVEAMRSIETGGKIKLSKIRKLCSCSSNPARKVYGKALSKVGRFIGLDESEERESSITKPNVNQRGANIPPKFLDDLFDDYEGIHPYQKGRKLKCVRVNEVDLLISVKAEKGGNDA